MVLFWNLEFICAYIPKILINFKQTITSPVEDLIWGIMADLIIMHLMSWKY